MKEIYGFDNIKDKIIENFKNNNLHHCNLINGQKGVGKSIFIYNIASIILSQKTDSRLIDEKEIYKTSKLIESGGHTDFSVLNVESLDVDGKENISKKGEINVNQVRKIINEIKLTSSISVNKVIMIDSIDNVNINGQNALLKTLEEPPKNTYIFLICHNINKVINTIQSRSNIINVPTLDIEEWSKALFTNDDVQEIELSNEEIEDLYNLSNASVGYVLNIIKNDAINLYDKILELINSKDIVEIQKFAASINTLELFDLFSNFLYKIFQNLIEFQYINIDNNFIEKRKELFQNILKKYTTENLIKYFEHSKKIIDDTNIYNLDKKHCITVLLK